MLLLPGDARRSSVGRGNGACSAQRGLRADEFREMVTEMAWNLGHALIRAAWLVTSGLYRGIFLRAVRN